MIQLIGISGSLRRGSYNTGLLRAAALLLPVDVQLTVKTIHGIPLYDGDVESADGIPVIVQQLKNEIAAADGLLFSTPEYNSSIPGVMKNAVDWLSRPGEDIPRVFGGKPVALLGASTGGLGSALGQNAWLPPLRALGTKPWFGGRLIVPSAHLAFDAEGRVTDPALREQLRQFLAGFARFVTPSAL